MHCPAPGAPRPSHRATAISASARSAFSWQTIPDELDDDEDDEWDDDTEEEEEEGEHEEEEWGDPGSDEEWDVAGQWR